MYSVQLYMWSKISIWVRMYSCTFRRACVRRGTSVARGSDALRHLVSGVEPGLMPYAIFVVVK